MRGAFVLVFAVMLAVPGCGDSLPDAAKSAGVPARTVELSSPPADVPIARGSAAPPQRYSVATFNVNYANQDLDEALTVIRAADVDLVCLQETTPQIERFLRDGLHESHRHAFFSDGEGELYAERFAFFSRTPIKDMTRVRRTKGLFDAWIATFEANQQVVQVASVHLQPVIIPAGGNPLAAISAIQAADTIRLTEVDSIVMALDKSLPSIVVGDFNSPSASQTYRAMRTYGLIDCLAEVHADADRHVTWKWPTPWGEGALRIDYLWRDERWRTEEVRVIPTKGSDHNFVMGRFVLTAP